MISIAAPPPAPKGAIHQSIPSRDYCLLSTATVQYTVQCTTCHFLLSNVTATEVYIPRCGSGRTRMISSHLDPYKIMDLDPTYFSEINYDKKKKRENFQTYFVAWKI